MPGGMNRSRTREEMIAEQHRQMGGRAITSPPKPNDSRPISRGGEVTNVGSAIGTGGTLTKIDDRPISRDARFNVAPGGGPGMGMNTAGGVAADPTKADLTNMGKVWNPFEGWTGEGKMFNAGKSALEPIIGFSSKLAENLANAPGVPQYATNQGGYFDTMNPAYQKLMGIDEAGQAKQVADYNALMEPFRQQQRQGMSNKFSAMGLGGGRLARAMAQMNSGFANETGQYGQQLQNAANEKKAMIAQMLNQDLGQREQLRNSQILGYLNSWGNAGNTLAGLSPAIMQSFKSGGE